LDLDDVDLVRAAVRSLAWAWACLLRAGLPAVRTSRPAAAIRATAASALASRCRGHAGARAGNDAWEPWARLKCCHKRGGDDASDSLGEDASQLEHEVEDEDEDAEPDGYGGVQLGSRRWRLPAGVAGCSRAHLAAAASS